jgi:putative ABC transport system permease protein
MGTLKTPLVLAVRRFSTFSLALRLVSREWRAGELRVLVLALVVAVGAVTSVGFFADRTHNALERQGTELLAADLRLASAKPLPDEVHRAAADYRLKTAQTVSFPSMVLAGECMKLAEIKAVGPDYPLRGQLRIATGSGAPETATRTLPEPGTIWLEQGLFNALDIRVGDIVTVGERRLTATRVLTYEPDRGGELFSIGLHVLMNLEDLPSTELIQPGSRVRYRLLLAGEVEDLAAFRSFIKERLEPGMRLEGVQDARPELRAALDRARRFLGLATIASVLLAGVAVAVAAGRFSARQVDTAAMMRCFGVSQRRITGLYLSQLLVLGLTAGLLGGLLGLIGQAGLTRLLGGLIPESLPAPSPTPLLAGLLTSLLTLMGFALPPLLRLKDTPTLRVLRRELGAPKASPLLTYALGFLALALLLLWQAGDLELGGYVLLGAVGTALGLMGVALALVVGLGAVRSRVGVTWGYGIANLSRRAGASAAQVAALGLGVMVLLVLSVVRADLLKGWQTSLPRDAPNRFLINIQPDQVETLQAFIRRHGLPPPELFPMVRGRLIAINGREVSAAHYTDDRAKRLVAREFNLSWTTRIAQDNRVVAGHWWTPADEGRPVFSVEQGIAETLGIRLGDRLTYRIADQDLTGTVNSLREVNWDSFRVNFFVITPAGVLEAFPKTYITSFYLPRDRQEVLNALVRAFPNVTVIDVEAVMTQVRTIMDRLTQALEYVFLFTLASGMVVLYAALQATHDERLQESAVLRTLGARRHQLVSAWLTEFTTLGVLSGLVAAVAASLLAYVLAEHVLKLPYHFNHWLYLWGPLVGALGAILVGFLGMRGVLKRAPLETLRTL